MADRAKNGVTGKEGYEGNGLSRRRQGFKSPWGRQQGIKAPAVMQVPFSFQPLRETARAFLFGNILYIQTVVQSVAMGSAVFTMESFDEFISKISCPMEEIASKENDYNLNISRYISTAEPEADVDLAAVHKELVEIESRIAAATARHNNFLRELGLPEIK